MGEQEIEDAEDVREKMLAVIRRQNSNVAGISKEYYLRLEIAGPEYPDLDLLDLPGLVVNPGSDEPETMEKDTHELLDMWIQRTKGRAPLPAPGHQFDERDDDDEAVEGVFKNAAYAVR